MSTVPPKPSDVPKECTHSNLEFLGENHGVRFLRCEACQGVRGPGRPRLVLPGLAAGRADRRDPVMMRRAFRAAATAAAAVAFVAGVEFLSRWMRRRGRFENVVTPAPARLRARRGVDGGHATFAIEGALDELSARLLVCSIAQAPDAAPVTLDLTVAGPIEGRPFDIFAGVFTAGRPIRLRGLGEDHATLPDRLAQRGLFTAVLDRAV